MSSPGSVCLVAQCMTDNIQHPKSSNRSILNGARAQPLTQMNHLGIHGYIELQVWPYCLRKIQHIWHFPLVRRTSKPALHHCHPVLCQGSCLQCTDPAGINQMTQQNMIAEMIAAERCCADLMLGISLDGTDPTLPWSACLSVRVMHQTCRWQVADGLLAIGHGEFTPDAS